MIRFLFLILITKGILFGCTLCTIYSPQTKVIVSIKADDKKIKTANITWVLTKDFTNQLKQIYDRNQNNHLEKRELEPVEQSLLDYIEEKNFLTHISYDKIIDKKKSNEIAVNSYKTYIKNSILHFDYELKLDYDVISDNALYINFNDDEEYFLLSIAKNLSTIIAPFETSKVQEKQSLIFYINAKDKTLEEKKDEEIVKKDELEIKKEETLLASFSKRVKEYLAKIDGGDNIALLILLGISFIYGILHALGPGHGKSLAFSYFVANKSSYIKAFWISQLSAFIHILGALILVVISVFILQSVLNNFVNDSVEILTKVSAILIILLAMYILYNKIKNKSCACSSCCSTNTNKSSNSTWSVNKPTKTNSLKPKFMKQDLYFVLTAGLIPCPGTVVLFIYAFILKTYTAVILASIFISLGMGVVIFASSFLGVSINNLSKRSHNLTNFLEILAPIIMFILGILLFLNANII